MKEQSLQKSTKDTGINGLPKSLYSGKKVLTNPHAKAGVTLATQKKVEKGWTR